MVEDARALVDLDEPLDAYGDGVVRRLECQVAGLLGTAEAAFFPSGMMAQQAALRIHAARQGQGVVALHPLSHPQLRESDALTAVAGLRSEEHTSELQSLLRISYAGFCLTKKRKHKT